MTILTVRQVAGGDHFHEGACHVHQGLERAFPLVRARRGLEGFAGRDRSPGDATVRVGRVPRYIANSGR